MIPNTNTKEQPTTMTTIDTTTTDHTEASENDTESGPTMADDLRRFAAWLEERPEVMERISYPTFYVFSYNLTDWQNTNKAIGAFEKSASTYYLTSAVAFGKVRFQHCVGKEVTCEKKVIGTRQVERPVVIETDEVEVVEEDIVGWVWPAAWR